MALQLLKRPRPLPAFKDEEKGIHAQWKIKVNIGYVENVNDDILDVRGCDFRLLIFGVQHVEVKPIRDDRELQLSRISPFHCFNIW
uniref:CACTA en-spm transposon protein n=1 Tax=Caenorhabditis tropicalis TaxID=1561998 RepID=A0A1I7TR80_9PELO